MVVEDVNYVLQEYVQSLDNLPQEITHISTELKAYDGQYTELRRKIAVRDAQIMKQQKTGGTLAENVAEVKNVPRIKADFVRILEVQDRKIELADKALDIINKHLKVLYDEIARLESQGLMTEEKLVPAPSAGTYANGYSGAYSNQSMTHNNYYKKRKTTSSAHDTASGYNGTDNDDQNEDTRLYCVCNSVSYGDMVACDGPDCKREWFHWSCVGLTTAPKGSWYCDECSIKESRIGRVKRK